MTNTPIDRESVDRLAKMVAIACDILKDEFETLRAALDEAEEQITAMEEGLTAVHMSGYMDGKKAAEEEIARLRQLIPRPDQTEDELVWRDHMRGVPLATLAKEFGVTKERMRHRLKKISERKLHLTENPDG